MDSDYWDTGGFGDDRIECQYLSGGAGKVVYFVPVLL